MRIVFYSFFVLSMLISNISAEEKTRSSAERGAYFYNYDDENSTTTNTKSKSKKSQNDDLAELIKIAKEQLKVQKEIRDLLSEEFNPTPQKVVINGVECIANSSADCFVMPLTKDAKKIPVLKAMLINPTPETAKNYLQWQAKYLSTGPFKVGRSFQYAINTYGEEAYPMNITRSDANSNTNELSAKRKKLRAKLLEDMYKNNSLGVYIFLGNKGLDYFSMRELSKIVKNIKTKSAVKLIFQSNSEKDSFLKASEATADTKGAFKNTSILVNAKAFKANNIYMTPTYMAVSKLNDSSKKQAVAIGRVSKDSLNAKIYEWLEQESIIERGGLSDYKAWNAEETK